MLECTSFLSFDHFSGMQGISSQARNQTYATHSGSVESYNHRTTEEVQNAFIFKDRLYDCFTCSTSTT